MVMNERIFLHTLELKGSEAPHNSSIKILLSTRISGAVKLPLHSSADTGKHDMCIMSNCNVGEGSVD